MFDEKQQNRPKLKIFSSNSRFLFLISVSVAALVLTFLISFTSISFTLKLCIFLLITVVYIALTAFIYFSQSRNAAELTPETAVEEKKSEENIFSPEIEEKLAALEETNDIFGNSLKPSEMFKLVSSSIREIIPFSISALFLIDKTTDKLKLSHAFGRGANNLLETEFQADAGIAGKTFQADKVRIDNELALEKSVLPLEILQFIKTAIACPLIYQTENYGVLVFYGENESDYNDRTIKIFDAISSRISPLFLSSMTFERNLNNALTDSITNLPNERSLFMILENQVAESQRFRESRPLSVLSMDIKHFAELNTKFGYPVGDRILSFVAQTIREQLRQMDFLSRTTGDEFFAVLPTSTDVTTEAVVERVIQRFKNNPFEISVENEIFIELNFGMASFLTDGETAQDLLKIARIKKQEAKSSIKSSILWFPKGYSN